MKVTVNRAELMHELIHDLASERCLVHPLDETSCRVTPLDARDPEEAFVELRFYLTAWARARPGAVATVTA